MLIENDKFLNKSPIVTVVIPAYNHAQYIKQALQSVIDQTYSNIELIVLDDGSSDDTYRIAIEFRDLHPEVDITVLTKPNEGVCKTLNMGISMAHGDYICFLASDDFWRNDKIEKQIDFMENNQNIGLVFSDATFVYNKDISSDLWSMYKLGYQKYFTDGSSNIDLYTKLMIELFIPALTVLLRANSLQKIGKFDEKLPYEDLDMWLRFSLQSKIGYINEPLAFYRMHGNNISNNLKFMINGYFSTIFKHFKLPKLRKRYLYKIVLFFTICTRLVIQRIRKQFLRR